MNSDILSQLNDAQREAAACIEGPEMIIAGAGSGKTRTLTYRIAYLISQGIDPFNILALTFTNKAANEMKERIIKLVGGDARNIWMGTFHSVFARILRSEAPRLGYTSMFTIYDTDDSKAALKHIVKEFNADPKLYSPAAVLNRISMAKSNLIGPAEYASNPELQQEDQASRKPLIADIYKHYNSRLHRSNAMDFDDLLFNMNVLLRDFPEVLLKYQERFRYILVDEYQDTNYSQYLIVKKLAARYQNICVVGDDAQSIYAFRGANIQNIFNFKRDYPTLQLFKLEQNYRSTQNIVNAANSVIANNREQIKKEIWTSNGEGNKLRLLRAVDERDEGNQVAAAIRNARLDMDLDYKDFAILYRTNIQSRAVEEALRKAAVPYRIYQGLSFYGRREVKDVLAYLRLVINNHDDESLLRVINYPSRGIGQTTLDRIRIAAADNEVSLFTVIENVDAFGLGIGGGIVSRIQQFVLMVKRFSSEVAQHDAYTIAKEVVNHSGILRALKEDDDPDNANRIENIEELLNGIKEFCEKEEQFEPYDESGAPAETPELRTLDQFLQQVLLLTSEDKGEDKDGDKVSLMTIHAAKGLEFPYVFVVGMEENLFPSLMSLTSRQDLEEERRLFYVALTRAERQLTLSYASTRYMYGNSSAQEMSRFVEEIDQDYIEMPRKRSPFPPAGELPRPFFTAGRPAPAKRNLHPIASNVSKGPAVVNSAEVIGSYRVGMRVRHATFGEGSIRAFQDSGDSLKAVVLFDQVGEKKLLLRFAKLVIVTQ